jgi:hypothetical protein
VKCCETLEKFNIRHAHELEKNHTWRARDLGVPRRTRSLHGESRPSDEAGCRHASLYTGRDSRNKNGDGRNWCVRQAAIRALETERLKNAGIGVIGHQASDDCDAPLPEKRVIDGTGTWAILCTVQYSKS